MKEELGAIDDEVMMQREKLLSINEKVKETQSILFRTKQLVNFFSKAVNDDSIIKGFIVVIAIICIVLFALALGIKYRKEDVTKKQ